MTHRPGGSYKLGKPLTFNAMKISNDQKLFVGMKADATMRRQIDEGHTKGRPVFKPGDPAHLDTLRNGEDLYIGRVLEGGIPLEQLEDLRRNIRSIVGITFPESRGSGASLRVFAVEDDSGAGFAAAG